MTVPHKHPSDADAEHLRDLGSLLNRNIEIYLQSLSAEGIPAPSFRPEEKMAVSTQPEGLDAQRALVDVAERIIALTTGPAGLYGISRQFFENTAIQIAVDLDLPKALPLNRSMSAKQLAAVTGADTTIIVRTMRALTPLYIFEEAAPQVYQHTARSASMRDPSVKALMSFGGNDALLAAAHLPATLKDSGYRNVTEPTQVSFCRAYDTELGYFAHINHREPAMGIRFADAMAGTVKLSYEVGSIADIYPFENLEGTIVDIGGGKGQVMLSIAQRYPLANHRFVVQDLAGAVSAGNAACPTELAPRFGWSTHDFLAGHQPIRGAAAYFLRHIMHDWSDDYCRRILKPIADAMKPNGASRLLISDMIVPPMNAPKAVAHRDLLMMAHLAGMERTQAHFEELVSSVHSGLRLEKIWKLPTSGPGGFRILEFILHDG